MSKNNTIRKSDKKFIRLEKARIRAKFFDTKKREEMINELYKRFIKTEKPAEAKAPAVAKAIAGKEKPAVKKAVKAKKAAVK